MDDDLQDFSEENSKLIAKAAHEYDLVIRRCVRKRHKARRRLGSLVVRWLNRRIFGQEHNLVPSNFRSYRRPVIHGEEVKNNNALANPQALAEFAGFAAPPAR